MSENLLREIDPADAGISAAVSAAGHSCRCWTCACGTHWTSDILVVAFMESPDGDAFNNGIGAYMSEVLRGVAGFPGMRCLIIDLTGLRDIGRDTVLAALPYDCRAKEVSVLIVLPVRAALRVLLAVTRMDKLLESRCRGGVKSIAPDRDTALARAHGAKLELPYAADPALLALVQKVLIHALSGEPGLLSRYLDGQRDFVKRWEAHAGESSLLFAVRRGIPEFVQWLLANGVPVDGEVLAVAIDRGRSDVVRLLLEAGAEVEAHHNGVMPLCRAAARGNLDMVRDLVIAGADVFVEEPRGRKPFQIALDLGHADVAEYLRERTRPFIERLTPEQEAMLETFREKWRAIAFSCEPADFARAEAAVRRCCEAAGFRPPRRFVVAPGPDSAAREVHVAHQDGAWHINHWLMHTRPIERGVQHAARCLDSDVRARVEGSIMGSMIEVANDFEVFTPGPPARFAERAAGPSHAGLFGMLANADYLITVLGLPGTEYLAAHIDLAQCCGPCYWFRDVVILQDRPCELHRNAAGLHCDGGPAVRYRTGFRVWALNGVRVPQWLAEKRGDDIDPRQLLDIHNGEVRREFVRKVGLERICQALRAECVDRSGDYELLMLDLGDGHERPYLKMLNPSVGTWHVEGVDPDCQTVAEALAWRNQTDQPPEILT